MIRIYEISGIYSCVDLPLVYRIDESGKVTGPRTARFARHVEKDGELVKTVYETVDVTHVLEELERRSIDG